MPCFVYILFSASLNLYYIGSSGNPAERLKKHLCNHKGFTGKAKDWTIVYCERHESKTGALKREKQIKGWKNRKLVEQLVRGARLGSQQGPQDFSR
jgi:putative endonuclease